MVADRMNADQPADEIRVLIVDDHTVVRDGLTALISAESGMHVVGAAGDGEDAIRLAEELQPDVILLDLVMPRVDGVQATRQIKRDLPNARILVLTSFGEDHQVYAAIKAGAMGYLMKDTSSDELIEAIRNTFAGIPVMQPEIAQKLMREIQNQDEGMTSESALTEREIEILQHLAQGKSNQNIADDLFLSERTVRTHITNILGKLGLSNRTQAVLYALREGIAHIPYTRDDQGEGSA
jgi:NarL family two-component system response regulator LiaR